MNEDNNGIIFEHLIDLHDFNCVFCSTREETTGRRRLFLVCNDRKRIYIRNGMKDTWDELKDQHQYDRVRDGFYHAIEERKIPCFRHGLPF